MSNADYRTITIVLSPHQSAVVDNLARGGRYESKEDVIKAAIRLLEDRENMSGVLSKMRHLDLPGLLQRSAGAKRKARSGK